MTSYMPRNHLYTQNTYGAAHSKYSTKPRNLKPYGGISSGLPRKSSSSSLSGYIYNQNTGSKYLKGKCLGKGGFAKCYLVTEVSTGKVYAAKVIDKRSLKKAKTKEKLGTEIKIHKSLNHKYICKYESFFEDSSYVYILLEICKCRSMMDLHRDRRSFTMKETKYLLYQLMKGIEHMHGRLIIHRDLKLGNLFLDADENGALQVKIGDFGLATQLAVDSERKTTICGTPNYIAPEILMNAKNGHSFEVDVWSFGVILYTCLNPTGKPPFETTDVKTTYRRIKNNHYRMFSGCDSMAQNLISSILNTDPEHRPTVKDILSHPFFAGAENLKCPSSLVAWASKCTGKTYPVSYKSNPLSSKPLSLMKKSDANIYAKRNEYKEPSPKNNLLAAAPQPAARFESKKPTVEPHLTKPVKKDDEVSIMHANLTRSFAGITVSSPSTEDNLTTLTPKIWVEEYADFSEKYGLAYRFNTGIVGAFFNDCTKMLWNPNSGEVEYIPRRSSSALTEPVRELYNIDRYPESLKKKFVLIDYFKKHFDKKKTFQKENIPPLAGQNYNCVKMWVKTPHSYVFRMSNRSVQVAFFEDKSEIILSNEAKVVTYKNRSGERRTHTLASVMKSYNDPGLSKRLKYTKDVLYSLITKKK